jgi:hypothetical protein
MTMHPKSCRYCAGLGDKTHGVSEPLLGDQYNQGTIPQNSMPADAKVVEVGLSIGLGSVIALPQASSLSKILTSPDLACERIADGQRNPASARCSSPAPFHGCETLVQHRRHTQ